MFVALDANDGSDYYDDTIDIIPSINFAQDTLVSVINTTYGQKKLGEEIFQELAFTRVFEPSDFSRVEFNTTALGHEVWTILAVFPLITTIPVAPTPTVNNAEDSEYRNDITVDDITSSANRVSAEQWAKKSVSKFVPGSTLNSGCPDLETYAYRGISDFAGSYSISKEITISPSVKDKFIGIEYVRVPPKVVVIGDTILFPASVKNALVTLALNFISWKQGDQTNLKGVTDEATALLLKTVL